MESDKRLETMEDELKLMKGELKQTLASVRDYLLNMELPASEFATVIAALGGDSQQRITMRGSFDLPKDTGPVSPAEERLQEESPLEELEEEPLEPESELSPEEEEFAGQDEPSMSESELRPEEEEFAGQDEPSMSESGLPSEKESFMPESELPSEEESFMPESELPPEEESFMPESELPSEEESFMPESELPPEDEMIDREEGLELEPELLSEEAEPYEGEESFMPKSELPAEEEQPMEYENIRAQARQSTPRVNLLANLIHWVAKAKKEIGSEQLTTFLEVYGISGHLSPELKDTILNLVEITSDQPEDADSAAHWSQSMLALHGILTGGDAPLHALRPFWGNGDGEIQPVEPEPAEAEVDKPKDMPLKLKLVFPNGDGKDKEFCINLTPEVDNNDS